MIIGNVSQLTVVYHSKEPCFAPITFDIHNHSLYWIKGKSGIGKSSLFHAMCHCIPTHISGEVLGSINYEGKNIQELSSIERVNMVGLVFQQPHWQFATTKVESELAFVLESLQVQRDEMKCRIEQILEQFDMIHLKEKLLNHCSLGEQQLVALASVLIARPKILFLDEALSAVQRNKKEKIIQTLNQMKGEMTIFVIDHDAQATWEADKIIQLESWERN